MIFLHLLLGIILGKLYGYTLLFIIASVIPDIDHLYIILKNKLYRKDKLLDALKNEEKYGLRFKTPLIHSFLGLIICTLIFYLIFFQAKLALYFASAYLLHLLLDWPEKDKKQYLYPLKIEFEGALPIWSKQEKAATIFALLAALTLFIKEYLP